MSESLDALRSLLRVIRQRISPKGQNSMWHDHVMAEYRRNAGERDPAKLKELAKLAADYTNLVRDVHHERVGLLMSTAPGLLGSLMLQSHLRTYSEVTM